MPATAIVVPVLEARAVADRWRRAHTGDGREGMPPHVTLLYPFVDDAALTEAHVRAVEKLVGGFEPFAFALTGLAEFAPAVLYLVPEPAEPFRALTAALAERFPGHPPYGGAFAEIVPHVTLAEGADAPMDEIRADVAPALPIAAYAGEAWLMRLDGTWTTHARIPLGAG